MTLMRALYGHIAPVKVELDDGRLGVHLNSGPHALAPRPAPAGNGVGSTPWRHHGIGQRAGEMSVVRRRSFAIDLSAASSMSRSDTPAYAGVVLIAA